MGNVRDNGIHTSRLLDAGYWAAAGLLHWSTMPGDPLETGAPCSQHGFAGERYVVLWVFCSRVDHGHHCGSSQMNRLHGAIDIWSVMSISGASSFQSMVCKNQLQLLNGALVGLCSDFLLFRHVMMFFKW